MAGRITIKSVAKTAGVSAGSVKDNVGNLLKTLPLKQQIEVMEYMVYCKSIRNRKDEIE